MQNPAAAQGVQDNQGQEQTCKDAGSGSGDAPAGIACTQAKAEPARLEAPTPPTPPAPMPEVPLPAPIVIKLEKEDDEAALQEQLQISELLKEFDDSQPDNENVQPAVNSDEVKQVVDRITDSGGVDGVDGVAMVEPAALPIQKPVEAQVKTSEEAPKDVPGQVLVEEAPVHVTAQVPGMPVDPAVAGHKESDPAAAVALDVWEPAAEAGKKSERQQNDAPATMTVPAPLQAEDATAASNDKAAHDIHVEVGEGAGAVSERVADGMLIPPGEAVAVEASKEQPASMQRYPVPPEKASQAEVPAYETAPQMPVKVEAAEAGGATTAPVVCPMNLESYHRPPIPPPPPPPFGPHSKSPSGKRNSGQTAVVDSLEEAFNFYDHCLDVMMEGKNAEDSEDMLSCLASSLQHDSMSTAYSGVCAPEAAFSIWKHRVSQRLGLDVELPSLEGKIGHMIEWNKESQAECQLASPGACLFGDISQFWRDELKDVVADLLRRPAMAMQVLTPLILQGGAVKLCSYCITHKKICRLRTCKRHVAGTSCRGFSRRGVCRGCTTASFLQGITCRLCPPTLSIST